MPEPLTSTLPPANRPSSRSLADPASRAYYDRKRAQDKTPTQALLCFARRRIDVLFAMLRDGTFYESRPAEAAA